MMGPTYPAGSGGSGGGADLGPVNARIGDVERRVDAVESTLPELATSTALSQLATDTQTAISGRATTGALAAQTARIDALSSRAAKDVSVLDFGADPTGASNSSDAFQSALDLALSGPVRIRVPAGTYRVAGLVLRSYTSLVGDGIGRSILKAPAGSNLDILKTANADSLFGTNNPGGTHHFSVRDLLIDGDWQGTTARGLVIYGYAFDLRDVEIRKMRGDGIVSEWWDGPAWQDDNNNSVMESMLSSVRVQACYGHGIAWNGPHDSTWLDVIACDNDYNHNSTTKYGVYVGPKGAGLTGYQIHSWGYYQHRAFHVAGVNVTLDGSSADGFWADGVYVAADQFRWNGRILQWTPANANAAPHSTCKGIVLAAGVRDYRIEADVWDMKAASIDFGTCGPGYLRVYGRINNGSLQAGSVGYLGTPHAGGIYELSIAGSSSWSALNQSWMGENRPGIYSPTGVSGLSWVGTTGARITLGGHDTEILSQTHREHRFGHFATAGDIRVREHMLRADVPSAGAVALTTTGAAADASNQINVAPNGVLRFEAVVVAKGTDVAGEHAAWRIEGVAARGPTAGSISVSASVVTPLFASDSGWSASVSADVGSGALRVSVSGAAGKAVKAIAHVTTTEISAS